MLTNLFKRDEKIRKALVERTEVQYDTSKWSTGILRYYMYNTKEGKSELRQRKTLSILQYAARIELHKAWDFEAVKPEAQNSSTEKVFWHFKLFFKHMWKRCTRTYGPERYQCKKVGDFWDDFVWFCYR